MQRFTVFSVFLTASLSAKAQFNDSTFYYFKYASTGIVNRTNDANSFVLNNAVNLGINKKKVSSNISSAWVYGQQNKSLTNNDFSSYADVDLFKNMHRLYYWGLLTYETSFSLKINRRLQTGAGITYTAIKDSTATLVLSDGFLYETGDLIDAQLGKDLYQAIRNSFRIKYRWLIRDKLILEGTAFYQPSVTDITDYNIKSVTNLTLKLRRWLGITASGVYNSINRTKRDNLLITFGLTVEKYF